MNTSSIASNKTVTQEEIEQLKQSLPKASYRGTADVFIKYQNFWIVRDTDQLSGIVKLQQHFVARDTDIVITSIPKTGTTWLRSLLIATLERAKHHPVANNIDHPLVNHHPSELVPRLELVYGDGGDDIDHKTTSARLDEVPSPRLFFTHLPYESLPQSIKSSKCRILNITRNPLDTVVSSWYFHNNIMKIRNGEEYKPPCFEDYFEDFCDGRFIYGPFFEHVIGYWKQSLETPDKVLFLTYEDLKDDTIGHLKNVAMFVGVPFSKEEENEGVVEQIVELCSLRSMKNMDVNKSGVINKIFEKKSFFRKGEVGDWTNHFNTNMVEKMKDLMEHKLKGTGLSFRLLPNEK